MQNVISQICDRLLANEMEPFPGPPQGAQQADSQIATMQCPFPVTSPHEIKPDLVKLDPTAPLIVVDSSPQAWRENLQRKAHRLRSCHALLVSAGFTEEDLGFWAHEVAQALSIRVPQGPANRGGGLPWLGHHATCDPLAFFVGLTLSLQEDFVLMAPLAVAESQASTASQQLAARLLSVCFPSGWSPREKLDRSLFDIHTPVADNERIQKAAGSLTWAMANKGPFERYVYTLAPNNNLWRDPSPTRWEKVGTLAEVWFRVERQITIPLHGQGSLFLIRVFVAPLPEVLSVPERAVLLARALESMSDELLRYKGLSHVSEQIINALWRNQ
jgi:hypothetical protein